jgi:hypothetical protein
MQQGILVTAYKHADWLSRVLNRLGRDFSFFIHVDRKSSPRDREQYRNLSHSQRNPIVVCSQYEVNWGGFNHLRAILLLVQKALESGMDYCHLITGQDYPVKSADYFHTQLDGKQNYIEFFPLPTNRWRDGGLDRLAYYHLHDVFDAKTRFGGVSLTLLSALQRALHHRRHLPSTIRFYGGSTYWSLNRACLEYVLDYIEHDPYFLDRFRHTFCSEEIFFQTILLNSPLHETLVNDNRRYICWHGRHGSVPAILEEEDFSSIMSSNALFARKMAYPVSQGLVDQIDLAVHSVVSRAGKQRGG